MGRPRRHDQEAARSLLDAAERIVEADGVDGLTVRSVAEAGGTTTRAVYSVFGSKDGLVVALGRRAFDLLRDELDRLPTTGDAVDDLVEAGIVVWRRFVLDHPALFELAVQRAMPDPGLASEFRPAAAEAMAGLVRRVERLELGDRSPRDATRAFHALCEGLAALELRGFLPAGDEERAWRDALGALVAGLSPPRARGRRGAARSAP
jgi:AcrR family transcriptional regulator